MQMKSVPWLLWLVPVAVLLIATQWMPYGYYTFTRLVVCGIAGFVAYASWDEGSGSKVWAIAFALVAALFNPIVPIYLKRATWFNFDVGVAILFAAHLVLVRLRKVHQA